MTRTPKASALIIAAALATGAGTAAAVDPMPLNEGPVEFIPTLKVSQGYDTNVDQAPDGERESSNVTKIAPTFLFRAQERANRYRLRYTPTFQRYSHESDDNRINHRARASSRMVLDGRNRVNLGASFSRVQATLTDTNRANDEDTGNINNKTNVDGTYLFGARGAKGQLELDAGYEWNRYSNHLTSGSNNQSKEYNSPRVGATFYWRVAPKTQVLVGGQYAKYNYRWSESTIDSKNMSGYVGARWSATAKTTGSVRVGRSEKNFDNAGIDDETITSWEANVTWRPASYSTVRLSTENTFDEGSETDTDELRESTIEQATYSLRWTYDWDPQISSNVGYRFQDKKYKGGESAGRKDEINTVTVGVTYSFRRWLDFGIETEFKDNHSTLDSASYKRNTYFLTATVSL